MVIIYTNFVMLESLMLHTNFKILGLLVLEKKILKVFTIYGPGGNLSHVTLSIYTNFCSLFPRRLHMKFGFDWPRGFRGEMFEQLWMMDGRLQMPK